MWTDYGLFTHSSADGHLGHFQVWAIMSDIHSYSSFRVDMCLASLGYIPMSQISGSDANSIYCFEDLRDSFPKWLHHLTFPLAVLEGSNFSEFLPTLVIICLLMLAIYWV